jgi:hypothetical protein
MAAKTFEGDYRKLITGQHRDKPNFMAAVAGTVQGLIDAGNLALSLPAAFDLDTAVGAQLDAIGQWVGVNRAVPQPLTGLYFTWDDTTTLTWDKGYWQGPFDPSSGIVNVDDVTYRTMIRAKIAANNWDGSTAGMYRALELAFGVGTIVIQDNFDMTLTLIYDSTILTPVLIALLTNGYFKLKPTGVKIIYVSKSSAPLMSWDRNLPKFQGWNGVAVWT